MSSPRVCPRCGTETRVLETRDSGNRTKRIRMCTAQACRFRFGTVEIIRSRGATPDAILIPRLLVRRVRKHVVSLLEVLDEILGSTLEEDERQRGIDGPGGGT